MKKVLITLAVVMLSKSMIAQKVSSADVPQPVIAAFSARFPSGKTEKWDKRKEGYIATFRQDGKILYAYYTPDGSWHATETPVRATKDLPAKVRSAWRHSGYYDWHVNSIKQIETAKQHLYLLDLNNGTLLDSDHHDTHRREHILCITLHGQIIPADQAKIGVF